jgi:succinate dehydrogenase/fumarate reductase flavoprotein subunit
MKGGLRINPECRVVNNYGEIIPGLYAAGEVTGGLFGKGVYLGAVLWPASLTFGRLAGRNAASELPWG